VKRFVPSGEEICAGPKKCKNSFNINNLQNIGEEICALQVKRFVQKEECVYFQWFR
jgi:hypothetical protein